MTKFVFCAVLFFFSFHLVQSAHASEGSFSVEPVFTDIRLGDESEQRFSLEVGNTTDEPIVFRLSFIDFGSLDESGGIAFLSEGTALQQRYGLASWMSAERDVVTVFPETKESIQLTVTNKESLSPGGHYGAVLFRVEKEGEDGVSNNVSISPNFTALVFVRKTGGEITALEYRESTIDRDMLGAPEKIRERFRNGGNVHVTPRGIVEVRDMLGRIVRKGILNEESGIILPESYRLYPVMLKPLEKAFIPGFYTVHATYRFDGEEVFHDIPEQKVLATGLTFLWGAALAGLLLGGIIFIRKRNHHE